MNTEEKFSEDKDEHLRIENELLRLKLKAQYGNSFQMETMAEMPPEIENIFLKNVIAFEDQTNSGNRQTTTVFKKIGKPDYRLYEDLKPDEVEIKIESFLRMFNENGIDLSFLYNTYSNEVKYRYITEEFFLKEIDNINIPGMMCGFIYEEDYPNDEAEINNVTHCFMKDWQLMKFSEYSRGMDFEMINSKDEVISWDTASKKIGLFTDCFIEFKNDGYNIDHIQVDEQADGNLLGFSEGICRYDAIMENGETKCFEGPFKLYMRRDKENILWHIFHFIVPGFVL